MAAGRCSAGYGMRVNHPISRRFASEQDAEPERHADEMRALERRPHPLMAAPVDEERNRRRRKSKTWTARRRSLGSAENLGMTDAAADARRDRHQTERDG